MKIELFCLFLCLSLTACAHSPSNPVIKDQILNVGTLATDASRRMVLVTTSYDKDKILVSKYCAEPSPDVSENVMTTLKLAMEGSAKLTSTPLDASAQLDLERSLQTVMQGLFKRTQGVQLFRDGLFNLCQCYVNGAITSQDYLTRYDSLLEIASELIQLEIHLPTFVPAAPKN